MFTDTCGRTIEYLRLSLTGACPMRCNYCRPAEHRYQPDSATVSADEIEQLVRHLVDRHGLRKVRLTGGEPTIRPDLLEIIRRLAAIDDLQELAMTTNGLTLARDARRLFDAGLHRINVSVDALDRNRFAEITGVDGLDRVLDGIDQARIVGLTPVKLNCVVLRDQNDCELPDLLRFAAANDLEIRFIELMPMGPLAESWSARFVSSEQMRDLLAGIVEQWTALPTSAASARRYRALLYNGANVTVGFITPMSCNFCAACNRVRITAGGNVYPCLMGPPACNLLAGLRPRFRPDVVDQLLSRALLDKAVEHPSIGLNVMTVMGG